MFDFDVFWDEYFLNRLADFNQLRRARLRMRFELSPFRPVIRLVVVIHVAQQQAGRGSVDDQPHVAVHPDRPNFLSGPVPLVARPISLPFLLLARSFLPSSLRVSHPLF